MTENIAVPDDIISAAIVYLNMARVNVDHRRHTLRLVKNQTGFHKKRTEKLLLASNWIADAVLVLHSCPGVEDKVQTHLPF